MIARSVLLAALLAVWLAGCATPAGGLAGAGPDRTATPTPTRETLPNGVVLIVQEHRAADVVALQVWVRVGGRSP